MYAQVDRFEENLAVFVFDDEQQLVLPRESLPAAARPGVAVRVNFTYRPDYAMLAQETRGDASSEAVAKAERAARWVVPVQVVLPAEGGRAGELSVMLADGQRLVLRGDLAPEPGGQLPQQGWLVFEVDADETARRRAYVRALVQRLFGGGTSQEAPREGGDV